MRPHLEFYPEDAGRSLAGSNQAHRWLFDSNIVTPMIRQNGQDFYVFEPALLSDQSLCLPIRWFKRFGDIYAKACRIREEYHQKSLGWVFLEYDQFEVPASHFVGSFPYLVSSFEQRHFTDPRLVHGEDAYVGIV